MDNNRKPSQFITPEQRDQLIRELRAAESRGELDRSLSGAFDSRLSTWEYKRVVESVLGLPGESL